MDKEMQAKVEEFVKEYGKRELSMEDLEKVVGGDICSVDGIWYTEEFLYDLAHSLTKACGYEIAFGVLCDKFGMSGDEKSVCTDLSDMQKIDIFVNTIIRVHGREHTY